MTDARRETETEFKDRLWRAEGESVIRFIDFIHSILENIDKPCFLYVAAQTPNREQLERDYLLTMSALKRSFKLEQREFDQRIQLAKARRRSCPYTAKQYDDAVMKAGSKKALIANELGVDLKTLRKWGRPAE